MRRIGRTGRMLRPRARGIQGVTQEITNGGPHMSESRKHSMGGHWRGVQALLAACTAIAFFVLAGGLTPGEAGAQSKTVTVVLSEEPDVLEPCQSSRSNIGRVLKQNIVESLTEIDPRNGSITPRLATSWEQLNSHTWRITLRKGVTFHDGTAFNAKSAIYGIRRIMNKKIDCEVRTKFFGGVKMTLKTAGSHAIDITTDKPAPILPVMLGTVTPMSPNTNFDKFTRNPIGTGPYRFVKWNVGSDITVERNTKYWGKRPQVEKGFYVWRTESAVRAAMVAAGEADIAPNIAVQDANKPGMDFSYPNSETSRLRIDVTRAPLNDLRVRQALNLAVDRDAIRGSILSKDVIPATQLVVPSISGHNPSLKVWRYYPQKAKQLLAQAKRDGVPVGKTIHLTGRINIYPNATEVMEALQAMYEAVGFKTKLQMLEVSQWLKLLQKPYPEDRPAVVLQSQHDNNNGDAVFTVFNKYHSDGANSTLNDKKLDKTIKQAEAAVGAERRKLWQQAMKRINDVIVADVPLFHMVGYTRVGKRIRYTPSISTNSELHLEEMSFR